MSGLAALLAGHNKPDIYLWKSSSAADHVKHAVEHAGWRFAYVDGWRVEDKTGFLTAAAAALGLGDEAGQSFDSLSDSLGDVSAGDTEGVLLLWDGWGPLARADEQAFSVSLSVLGGRVNADRGGRFAVVLRGEGPPIDVPTLEPHPA